MTPAEFREKHVPKLVRELAPAEVIAFGSQVRGDALAGSDLDLLIVSEAFQGMFFTDRVAKVLELLGTTQRLDTLCYTPEEFERKRSQIGIVRLAMSEGRSLL